MPKEMRAYRVFIHRPYAINTPDYVCDTTDLWRKIESTDNLPGNPTLGTVDVEPLYTNIPHKDG